MMYRFCNKAKKSKCTIGTCYHAVEHTCCECKKRSCPKDNTARCIPVKEKK